MACCICGGMSLSAEVKKLAQQALIIKNSQVPLHRAIDVLATQDGDVSRVLNQYRDIKDADLRRALHYCAELLRTVEREAGLTPAWEASASKKPAPSAPDTPAAKPAEKVSAPEVPSKNQELTPFVDESARGQVRVAKAYTDGASKGNPGPSGIGVVIFTMDGRKIAQQALAIGVATNNIAEYSALIEAMRMARDLEIKVLNVISDSELMVRQVSGVYKIKNAEILKKVQEVMELRRGFEKFSISYVGREHNTLADALSTSVLKSRKSSSAKRTKSSGASGAGGAGSPEDEPYRDMLGPVDTHADDGSTE